MSRALRTAGEQRPGAETEEQELQNEEGDEGEVGEALRLSQYGQELWELVRGGDIPFCCTNCGILLVGLGSKGSVARHSSDMSRCGGYRVSERGS